MKKHLCLFFLLIFFSRLTYAQNYNINEFVIINWTDDQFNANDIEFTYDGEEDRSYYWGDTVQEYSIKRILLDHEVKSITIRGLFSNVNLPLTNPNNPSAYVLVRGVVRSYWIKLITTSLTGQIVGINICNNMETFGRVRHFLVANLSKSKVTLNNILYKDSQLQQIGVDVEPYSLEIFPIYTEILNLTFVQGKEIRNYNLSYNTIQNLRDIRYKADSCIFSTTQDMIVGVEISNSGTDDSLKVVW